jgi:hypothetical protein
MARKKTLNQRRLTRLEVRELISSGARLRPDLTAALASDGQGLRAYELAGDRYLLVFGELFPGLAGKGDIYAADVFSGSCAGRRRRMKTPGMGAKARSGIGPTIRRGNIS